MQGGSSNTVRIYYPGYSREELVKRLKEASERLARILPLELVVLFGSYAKNRYTATSDVDILIVYRDPKRGDAHKICWEVLNIPEAEIFIYTRSEYEKLIRSNSQFVKQALREGIIVWRSTPHLDQNRA